MSGSYFDHEGADDEVMPVSDALRSMEWALSRLEAARRERDTYRMLFEKLDAAMRGYVAEVRPLLASGPWASATAGNIAKRKEHVARAKAYRALGMKVPAIALTMGKEDQRGTTYGESGVAYPQETVRRWLRTK